MSDGKCRTEKNYQKNKILDENVYLLELIVFDDWVTKISLKGYLSYKTILCHKVALMCS